MKKTANLACKSTQETHDALIALAHLEDKTTSEFIDDLITARLNLELSRLKILTKWAQSDINLVNKVND